MRLAAQRPANFLPFRAHFRAINSKSVFLHAILAPHAHLPRTQVPGSAGVADGEAMKTAGQRMMGGGAAMLSDGQSMMAKRQTMMTMGQGMTLAPARFAGAGVGGTGTP